MSGTDAEGTQTARRYSALDNEASLDVYSESDEREPTSVKDDDQNATVLSLVFNLSNNIVGAGMLSLPWCLREASAIGGLVLITVVGVLSGLSLVLIAVCCEYTQCFTFQKLGEKILGRRFCLIFQISMVIYTFFSCVSFLILVGDFFSGETGIANGFCERDCDSNLFVQIFGRRFTVVAILTIVVLYPLSCLKNLYALRYTSLISICSMTYVCAFLAVRFSQDGKSSAHINTSEITMSFFSAPPIVNVAFIAHYNAPKYYSELRDRRISSFALAVFLALGFCGIIYYGVAVFGYLLFGDETASDILTNFPDDDKGALVGRIAMSFVVLFTYPLAFNALRAATMALIQIRYPDVDCTTDRSFYIITTILVAVTFLPGSTIKDIGVVLDYKGATLGGLIGFGFGGIMFLSIFSNKRNESMQSLLHDDARELPKKKVLFWKGASYVFLMWAIVTGILGVIVTTVKLFE